MDSGNPAGNGSQPLFRSTPEWNFAFAFNDCDFSDRVLRIEIMPDSPDSKSDSDGCPKIAAWACNPKLRREGIRKENSINIPDLNDEENAAMIEMPPLGTETKSETGDNQGDDSLPIDEGYDVVETKSEIGAEDMQCDDSLPSDEGYAVVETKSEMGDDSLPNAEGSDVVEVKTIHVSSSILAAKSPFFYKLFKEFKQQEVTLRIHDSEEVAFMELLNFMYVNSVSITSPLALLQLLIAADIYEVDSCMRYCSRLILDSPMSIELALVYLDLPSRVLNVDAGQPLIDAAKQCIVNSYKDLTTYQEEALKLPLAGIEALLESDDLQAASEDSVFEFMLKWAGLHYPEVEERRKIIETNLVKLVRFPYMTARKLRKVTSLKDFDYNLAMKYVVEALFFKAEPPNRQQSLVSKETSASCRQYVARAYKYRPVQAVDLELCHPHCGCVVYFDLKREECASLFPAGRVYSQAFHLGGKGFFLSAHCTMDTQSSIYCFGLFLGMQEKGTVSFSVDYEFACKSKTSQGYTSKYKGTYKFTGGKAIGYRNLFGMPWTDFVADDCPFFINGILHLRAELTIRH